MIQFIYAFRGPGYEPSSVVADSEGLKMATLARVLSRISGTDVDVKTLKAIVVFCAVGLFLSLCLASYGLDLSPGFF